MRWKPFLEIAFFICCYCCSTAKAQEDGVVASSSCGSSIATAVVVTAVVVLVLVAAAYYAWRRYSTYKKGKHLILETDTEKGAEYAFDNPGFKESGLSPIGKVIDKTTVELGPKQKWTNWTPLSTLTGKSGKKKTVDDSALGDSEVKVISLRSHDFTGLGFNVCGNMRDGIYVKDVLQHGPASESGKLSPGDRITSVTINFEHMVYEDALTILSYASPYEVVLEAKNGKLVGNATTQSARPAHPLYKSASSTDLLQIGKSAKKRLFQAENLNSSHGSNRSSQEKSRSNATTLERSQNNSPIQKLPQKRSSKNPLNTDQLKTQLEHTILKDHKENLKNKREFDKSSVKTESEVQRSDGYQKLGIKVFPNEREQRSPKTAELSQNDNNINIEKIDPREMSISTDEVDETTTLQINQKEKRLPVDAGDTGAFIRRGSLTGSGIKRDENGIPQEIPNHMMNAAAAARRNRKSSLENLDEKTPKKLKGKAPAPPETQRDPEEKPHLGLNEIRSADNDVILRSTGKGIVVDVSSKNEVRPYESDSDQENDNQSSVNTIELNSSDITVHQTEEEDDEEKRNRKTASTGDLTKLQRIKDNSGTLERAQSLDITDTGIPALGKQCNADCNVNLNAQMISSDRELKLSSMLDGLNTFQRSRLKKSTEWGNLEDAILQPNKGISLENKETGEKYDNESDDGSFDLTAQAAPELDALVNKIKEIKEETTRSIEENEREILKGLNATGATLSKAVESIGEKPYKIENDTQFEESEKVDLNKETNSSFVDDVLDAVTSLRFPDNKSNEVGVPVNNMNASIDLLEAEREHSSKDYFRNNLEDTNVPDDIKVSRHSLSNDKSKSSEPPINTYFNENVSNITISDTSATPVETFSNAHENLYKTDDKIFVSTPDLIKNVSITEAIHDLNQVTIEGPTSLTFEIRGSPEMVDCKPNKTTNIPLGLMYEDVGYLSLSNGMMNNDHPEVGKQHSSLTYITEIQVVTPNNSKNTSEIEIGQKSKNLDSKFEDFIKNFESQSISNENIPNEAIGSAEEKIDVEKELHKIREIAEEQLKKLPEMRFTTSSYEPPRTQEKKQSQIELLRSNFERSPPKTKPEATVKSRIPVATTAKTPPTSPERRDSKNEFEMNKDIVEIMTTGRYQMPKPSTKNVTVTSIRGSKIPSGRPPVPPRKTEHHQEGSGVVRLSTNGNFKQWTLDPSDGTLGNVTTTTDGQMEK